MNIQLCSALKNQRGYMAIFIAMIFQVLFVFFAMIINIGLLVHDKINLQNSVDLAAYYAAGKQAEVLNAIAHSNYQIRQSWKLLSWRVRALGDMASKGHPFFEPMNVSVNSNAGDVPINDRYPIVCTQHSWWKLSPIKPGENIENFCKNKVEDAAVHFPDPPKVIAFWVQTNLATYEIMQDLRTQFDDACKASGIRSFYQTLKWMGAYKGDIANRAKVIEFYAKSLSANVGDFSDLENESVREGAKKTLEKNLTRSNQENLEMRLYNSFGHPSAGDGGWINKISVLPQIYYLDPIVLEEGDCKVEVKPCYQSPTYDSSQRAKDMARGICGEPPNLRDPYHSTVGYEKNPWIMGYVGVEATVKGRRPFAPFGAAVTLRARAFAKPFGGRIGPWFRTEWQRGSASSTSGDFVDRLLPAAVMPEGGESADGRNNKNISTPNYSRYPGDLIGLRSKLTLTQLRSAFLAKARSRLEADFWGLLPYATFEDSNADVLAWEPGKTEGPWIRQFEIAAVAPDLFDITYYSIDPQFSDTYIKASNNSIKARPDLGYRVGSPDYDPMNVWKQVKVYAPLYAESATYIIRDPGKLLTGWAPQQLAGSEYNYDFPDAVFAKCLSDFKNPARGIPGGCGYGGRVGYSVKLVSEEYLNDPEAGTGGGGNVGPIMNPPPPEFQ